MSLPCVGICAVFRDEAPYLREWMLFHWLQGVERFVLYDNESRDDWRAQIPELAAGVIAWPGRGTQLEAYQNCLAHQAEGIDWLAFIDVDEYLWDADGRTLTDVLEGVRGPRVSVAWRMFGDGGHATAALGLTIDAYLRCAPELGPHGKQIVRPEKVGLALTPHEFAARGKPAQIPGLRLNHYWTRSRAECEAKFARGRAAMPARRPWSEYLGARERLYQSIDGAASELYGPILRAELGEAP